MVVTEWRGGNLRRLPERGPTALQGGLSEGERDRWKLPLSWCGKSVSLTRACRSPSAPDVGVQDYEPRLQLDKKLSSSEYVAHLLAIPPLPSFLVG
jgi:hypothetical protein